MKMTWHGILYRVKQYPLLLATTTTKLSLCESLCESNVYMASLPPLKLTFPKIYEHSLTIIICAFSIYWWWIHKEKNRRATTAVMMMPLNVSISRLFPHTIFKFTYLPSYQDQPQKLPHQRHTTTESICAFRQKARLPSYIYSSQICTKTPLLFWIYLQVRFISSNFWILD